MATYHCSVKVIGRSSGRSSVAAAAYRSGDTLTNERDGITHDYSRKQGIEYSEILLPENAPQQFQEREILWNSVEQAERRKDAQTAREIEIALPSELNIKQQTALVRDYAQRNFVDKGMCADFSIHDTGSGNPHAHIMLSTRSIDQDGFGPKDRTWNDRQLVEQWREDWAKSYNREMGKKNLPDRVDHRSLKDQGIEREPTVHLGRAAQMEKRGIETERGNINRERQARAGQLGEINKELQALSTERERLAAEPAPKIAPPMSAEQTAAKLYNLQQNYTHISQQLEAERGQLNHIRQELHQLEGQRQNLEGYRNGLIELRQKADILEKNKVDIQSKGLFHDRKAVEGIDRQLDSIHKSQEQARANFRSTWERDPTPAQVNQLGKNLQDKAETLRHAAAKPAQAITKLQELQKSVALDYKTEKALAEIRPDYEQIKQARATSPAPQKTGVSVMQRIRDTENFQGLEHISRDEYIAIAQHLHEQQPELSAKILQRQEQREQGHHRGLERELGR